jgi:hypothetical protein
MQGSDPVTGKMPVPQVLPLKGQHYISATYSQGKRHRVSLGYLTLRRNTLKKNSHFSPHSFPPNTQFTLNILP